MLENLAKVEELCTSLSFYFSKIYDIEDSFDKRSKYACISKQIVFLAIQRAKLLLSAVEKRIHIMNENDILTEKIPDGSIAKLIKMVNDAENAYNSGRYVGIVAGLKDIGRNCSKIRNELLTLVGT
jgi:hypothetical protein